MENKNKYPIKVVSQQTGLSQFVIRAWEKRYNAVQPDRTNSNRRLYSRNDIDKLILLNNAIKSGHHIGGIAHLSINSLKELISEEEKTSGVLLQNEFSIKKESDIQYINSAVTAIKNFDSKLLESILMRASVNLPQPLLISEVVTPLIKKIGDMWKIGELRIAHEHLASSVLKNFLNNIVDTYNTPDAAPSVVITTPVGQNHEMGALIVSVVAASAGWKVTYLGSNLPAEEIAAAVEQTNARLLALSIVYPCDDVMLRKEIKKLRSMVVSKIRIIAGGSGANGYIDILREYGIEIISDLQIFRNELSQISLTSYN